MYILNTLHINKKKCELKRDNVSNNKITGQYVEIIIKCKICVWVSVKYYK